jgi:phosphoribosylformimino-5-aminoimidazole carboxamide ribonucleotide (ProFAR) isomerase
VNLGTAALEDPDWTETVIAEYGDRIAVGLDVKGHTLAARGWTTEGGDLWEAIGRLDAAGCTRYVVTDVEKDGMMHGPNFHLLKQVTEATRSRVIASGGIHRLEDLHKLAEMKGIEGAIVGKALYEQAFSLPEALVAVEGRYDPYQWGPPQP